LKVSPSALDAVPARLAFEHKVLPLEISKTTLVVAIANPMNYWSRAVLSEFTGIQDVQCVLASAQDIETGLNRYYSREALSA
jgi:hypothetical protein